MKRGPVLGICAAALFGVAGCTSPVAPEAAVPCAAELVSAAQYTEQLAEARVERMKLMRFGSEAAMNAYIAENNRLESEAGRLRETLLTLPGGADYKSGYTQTPPENLTEEGAAALIAAADACVVRAKE